MQGSPLLGERETPLMNSRPASAAWSSRRASGGRRSVSSEVLATIAPRRSTTSSDSISGATLPMSDSAWLVVSTSSRARETAVSRTVRTLRSPATPRRAARRSDIQFSTSVAVSSASLPRASSDFARSPLAAFRYPSEVRPAASAAEIPTERRTILPERVSERRRDDEPCAATPMQSGYHADNRRKGFCNGADRVGNAARDCGSVRGGGSGEPLERARGVADDPLERAGEVGLVREAAGERDLRRRSVCVEHLAGAGDPEVELVGVGRGPHLLAEEPQEVELAQADLAGERVQRDGAREPVLDDAPRLRDLGSQGTSRKDAGEGREGRGAGGLHQLR